MVVVIDNYDSFTWNLVDILRQHCPDVRVFRNDAIGAAEVLALRPKGILISPGPGRPADSGVSQELLRLCAGKVPVLGICLGHQLIGEWAGALLTHSDAPVHGKTSPVLHEGDLLFEGLPNPFRAMRYHSLLLGPDSLPEELEVIAQTDRAEIMGIRHKSFNIAGVQFHPESILTETGERIIANWTRTL